jgi:hypothetical protein
MCRLQLGIIGWTGGRLPGVVFPLRVGICRSSLAQTQDVGRGVDRDARKPCPEGRAAEPVKVAIGAEERLLDRIGRGVAVTSTTR